MTKISAGDWNQYFSLKGNTVKYVPYSQKLKQRKLALRLAGWRERGHLHRCGHYWINERYGKERFSLKEAEAILRKEKDENSSPRQPARNKA